MIGRGERISIHNLVLPEVEQTANLPFVPERDLTDGDWTNINFIFENFGPNDTFYYKVASCLKILSPERFSKYSVLQPSDTMWDPLLEYGDNLEREQTEEAVAILFPGYITNFKEDESIKKINSTEDTRLKLEEMWTLKINKPYRYRNKAAI